MVIRNMQDFDPKGGFSLGKAGLSLGGDKLVNNAGLGTILSIFDSMPLAKEFAECLPLRTSNNSQGSYRLALILLSSLIHGHDCLDDIEGEFFDHPGMRNIFKGEIPVAKTFGDYLRSFEPEHLEKLNTFLLRMGFTLRDHLERFLPEEFKPQKNPHFSIDSTAHEQSGDKIEGCATNYKGQWCLNSEIVYDELGLNYGGLLQSGNTKPGSDGPKLITPILTAQKKLRKHPGERVSWVSGDSAYAHEAFIRACMSNQSTFTIAAHGNMRWEDQINGIDPDNWVPWEYSEQEQEKLKRRKQGLPQRFLARYHWSPSWAENIILPVIIKKEWRATPSPLLPDDGVWFYHAIITNEDLHKHSYQEVYSRYLTRANMENFIKETKVNYDGYHFPCLSFGANNAYLLFLLIAQNLLRWIALITNPDKPHYAKKLRRKYVFAVGRLVSHARKITLKVCRSFHQEVKKLIEAVGSQPVRIPQHLSTA